MYCSTVLPLGKSKGFLFIRISIMKRKYLIMESAAVPTLVKSCNSMSQALTWLDKKEENSSLYYIQEVWQR